MHIHTQNLHGIETPSKNCSSVMWTIWFHIYALQLLQFKWISRYEETNAYILIIYLLCINTTDGSYITSYTHLYLLLLAQHLVSSHWLSKTDWSWWWKETASILRKEDGIRSASWQSWRWMEGMIISQS